MKPAQIQTTTVDGKFPPPRLCGKRGEGEEQGGGGGEGEGQEKPGKKGEAEDDFHPRKGMRNGRGQPVGQHNLVRIDRREGLHRLTNFGEPGREKKKSEKSPDDHDGDPVHSAVTDRSWLREVGRIQVGGELGLEAPSWRRVCASDPS